MGKILEQVWRGGKPVSTKVVRSVPKSPKPTKIYGPKRKGSH
jgi:hypothetical protein